MQFMVSRNAWWIAPAAAMVPRFLLCNTYRYHGHHVGDINREYYRSKQEEQKWKTERDPITNLREMAGRAETRRCRSARSRSGRA